MTRGASGCGGNLRVILRRVLITGTTSHRAGSAAREGEASGLRALDWRGWEDRLSFEGRTRRGTELRYISIFVEEEGNLMAATDGGTGVPQEPMERTGPETAAGAEVTAETPARPRARARQVMVRRSGRERR